MLDDMRQHARVLAAEVGTEVVPGYVHAGIYDRMQDCYATAGSVGSWHHARHSPGIGATTQLAIHVAWRFGMWPDSTVVVEGDQLVETLRTTLATRHYRAAFRYTAHLVDEAGGVDAFLAGVVYGWPRLTRVPVFPSPGEVVVPNDHLVSLVVSDRVSYRNPRALVYGVRAASVITTSHLDAYEPERCDLVTDFPLLENGREGVVVATPHLWSLPRLAEEAERLGKESFEARFGRWGSAQSAATR